MVIARTVVGLVLFIAALTMAVRVYRRTYHADMILVLLIVWLAHGIVYYSVGLFLFVTLDPYPRELALVVNWWSSVLRYQILIALMIILKWHPGRE